MTLDEVHEDLDERMDRFRWVLQGVTGPCPWIYTIGLTERFGHPELVMAGIDLNVAGLALNDLGERIARGETLLPGRVGARVTEVDVELVAVHPAQITDGLVGFWEEHYWRASTPTPTLEVVQVVPQPRGRQPRLDLPHLGWADEPAHGRQRRRRR